MMYLIFPTSWGWMGVAGTSSGLRRLVLPCASSEEVEKALSVHTQQTVGAQLAAPLKQTVENPAFLDLANRLGLYFEGHKVSFNDDVDLTDATLFQREVWLALRDIPYGKTISYSELAAKLSSPQAARATGRALSKNPLPIILPCHRVIGQSGKVVGYAGGIGLKKQLLELEAKTLNK